MTCVLCFEQIDLWDLDAHGYSGEPAHTVCAQAARDAFGEACDRIAAEYRRRAERGRRAVA